MTLALGLYYALLVLWLLLLVPAIRVAGGARILLWLTIGLGILAVAHEVRMTFFTPEAIRIDIFLITVILGGLYAVAATQLFQRGWRRTAGALGVALGVIVLGMGYEIVQTGREGARLTANFNARNALLFEAKFRDRETYERVFGPFAARDDTDLPIGHWKAGDRAPYPRLIVNARGQAWLFYRCTDTECAVGPDGTPLVPASTGADAKASWQAELAPRVGAPWPVRINRTGPKSLRIETKGKSVDMTRMPPPIPTIVKPKRLEYLGRFAAITCIRAHADVRQLWLWRDGKRLFAVGVFRILLHGRKADFVTPVVLGKGKKEGAGWRFEWRREARAYAALIDIAGDKVTLTLTRPGRGPERATLADKPVFSDAAIELAPLSSPEDWEHWFKVVLMVHFTSGHVPPC
jgi:hypothetical protein